MRYRLLSCEVTREERTVLVAIRDPKRHLGVTFRAWTGGGRTLGAMIDAACRKRDDGDDGEDDDSPFSFQLRGELEVAKHAAATDDDDDDGGDPP